jgi:hypothetical protein
MRPLDQQNSPAVEDNRAHAHDWPFGVRPHIPKSSHPQILKFP